MSQENICLLCTTENAKYNKEFLSQRAFFSAPKLLELRLKWNEAIIKIHPVLENLVNNVNTYKICDLHFKESDIKKSISEKSSHQNLCTLPLWNWVLKIKALPLSSKELENDKYQIFKANEKCKENFNRLETNVVNQDHTYMNVKVLIQSENNNETKKCCPFKENKEFDKEKLKRKLNFQPIRHDRKNVKFAPYSINSDSKTECNKTSQIIQLPSEKNQVLFVTSEPKAVPPVSSNNSSISPSLTPFNAQNFVSPPTKFPVITNVTSLAPKTSKFISLRKITSLSPNYPSKVIPMLSVPKIQIPLTVNSNSSLVSVPSIAKKPVPITFANSISNVLREPPISLEDKATNNVKKLKQKIIQQSEKVKSPLTFSTSNADIYTRLKLLSDLKQNSLPSGWAYKLKDDDKLLFTQYCTLRKFPIFLSVDKDLVTAISLGYEAVKFIHYKIPINSFAEVCKGLRKMESLKWCLGIGFDQNNHSDMCLILSKTLNSRCHICSKIRHNAQRRENDEITKQRKQSKDLRPLMNKLKRINKQLDTKVCKLKLMVNHLKKKQCVECLHNKFIEKISIPIEYGSSTTKNN